MRKLLVITALLLFAGVSFGQTLIKGGVIGIHEWTIKLNPDVTMNQFLEFWEENGSPTQEGAAAMEKFGNLWEEIPKYGDFTYSVKDWIIL